MFGDLLISVPVYRCSREQFFAEEVERLAPYAALYEGDDARLCAEQLAGHRTWDYNAIVAWIEVRDLGDMIKLYAFETSAQRITKNPVEHSAFGVGNKISEEAWRYRDTNEAFALRLRKLIVRKGQRLAHGSRAKRYVDVRAFDQIAKRIDWESSFAVARSAA